MSTLENTKQLSNLEYLKTTCGGSMEMVQQITNMFIEGTPGSIENMKQLIGDSNWTDLKREAHKLKSSFLMMGATLTSSKLQEIESSAESLENGHLLNLIGEIDSESSIIYDEIKKELMTS